MIAAFINEKVSLYNCCAGLLHSLPAQLKGCLPCWKAIIKDILLLLVGRPNASVLFAFRDFTMTNGML